MKEENWRVAFDWPTLSSSFETFRNFLDPAGEWWHLDRSDWALPPSDSCFGYVEGNPRISKRPHEPTCLPLCLCTPVASVLSVLSLSVLMMFCSDFIVRDVSFQGNFVGRHGRSPGQAERQGHADGTRSEMQFMRRLQSNFFVTFLCFLWMSLFMICVDTILWFCSLSLFLTFCRWAAWPWKWKRGADSHGWWGFLPAGTGVQGILPAALRQTSPVLRLRRRLVLVSFTRILCRPFFCGTHLPNIGKTVNNRSWD